MDTGEAVRLSGEAGFVFRGRLVTEATRDAGDRAGDTAVGLVVVVDEVLRGTDVTRALVGYDVTLLTDDPDGVSSEGEYVFFTRVVSLGERVVVSALGHGSSSDDGLREVTTMVDVAEEEPLTRRVGEADLVVTGEVVSSRLMEPDAPASSEHDPQWWLARVAVGEVLRGRSRRKGLDVLFANSTDIAWYRSPKLREGMSGVFLLHGAAGEAALPADAPGTAYRCVDPLDFHPDERSELVRRVAGTEAGER